MTLLVIGLAIFWIVSLYQNKKNEKRKEKEDNAFVHEIHKTDNLSEMVSSIDYGRVYPFYTGMSRTEVKEIVRFSYVGRLKFNNQQELCEEIDTSPFVSLPNTCNPFVNDILLSFTEDNVVDSITISIKDYNKGNRTHLKELMCAKFGSHTPSDGRSIAWRDMRMVIRIDEIDGCIEVIYYKY